MAAIIICRCCRCRCCNGQRRCWQVARKTDNTENLKINPEASHFSHPGTQNHPRPPNHPSSLLSMPMTITPTRTRTRDAGALGIRVMKMRKSNSGHAHRWRGLPAAVIVAIRRAHIIPGSRAQNPEPRIQNPPPHPNRRPFLQLKLALVKSLA